MLQPGITVLFIHISSSSSSLSLLSLSLLSFLLLLSLSLFYDYYAINLLLLTYYYICLTSVPGGRMTLCICSFARRPLYIYIYIYRERERCITCVYIYIYIYTYLERERCKHTKHNLYMFRVLYCVHVMHGLYTTVSGFHSWHWQCILACDAPVMTSDQHGENIRPGTCCARHTNPTYIYASLRPQFAAPGTLCHNILLPPRIQTTYRMSFSCMSLHVYYTLSSVKSVILSLQLRQQALERAPWGIEHKGIICSPLLILSTW